MSGTPRLRSSYPSTPGSARQTPAAARGTPPSSRNGRSPLPDLPQAVNAPPPAHMPVIPVNLIDAPSQRMYAIAIYGLLLVWRLYDWWTLVEDERSSFMLFIKWAAIDSAYTFGVPLLRIPWLEWSDTTSAILALGHTVVNGMLMFRIPLPFESGLLLLARVFFDKELAISESSVRVSDILHNSSLIMGRQIIKVLPEGSATLNPDASPFCLDNQIPLVSIPLRFNQSVPLYVELLRIDFDTNFNETIVLSNKEIRKRIEEEDGTSTIHYSAKKPGLYRLLKVVDHTKLEVQRRMSNTLVTLCPKALIKSSASDKCRGDLSDLRIEVTGTPPLKIIYNRAVNNEQSVHHFQGIQPEDFESPLLGSAKVGTIVTYGSQDLSWARSQTIAIPLNETMISKGKWVYSIDEIHDALGNVARFSTSDDGEHRYPKGTQLEQTYEVHERPVVKLRGCDSHRPLQVGKGHPIQLPVDYSVSGDFTDSMETSHTLTWKFSPLDKLTKNGDHGDDFIVEEYFARVATNTPTIHESGLYTLTDVESKFCKGEVAEPTSCLLLNPPEPQLSISAESISDKCAGQSIGLLVSLDLVGTPPFIVKYDTIAGGQTTTESIKIQGLRHQIELKPMNAGHVKYHFTSIEDSVYPSQTLGGQGLALEQDVKPPASAYLIVPYSQINACLGESVEMNAGLSGEPPFTLEYELIHEGKRKKEKVVDIKTDEISITTGPFEKGGEYTLTLTSVQDKTGCKTFLNSVAKFTIQRQQPRASFGYIENKRHISKVEGKKISLPLKLEGQPPFTVRYRNMGDSSGKIQEMTAVATNDEISVRGRGTYELMGVDDKHCPGVVDLKASSFEVEWLSRPEIVFPSTTALVFEDGKYLKREICEGDIDSVDVKIIGAPPYTFKYQIRHKLQRGSGTISNKVFDAALGQATISMDTNKAGIHEYKFVELSDALYEHDSKKFSPLILEQNVNQKPTARFIKPGQSYKYCNQETAGDEIIPIKLEGKPPFSLEVDIKHQSNSKPETVKIANIESNHYDFRIPHHVLSLGIHQVSVRKVRDANGCQQKTEYGAPHVQVQVYDVPTISALDSRQDYCVGERISYSLAGTAPFEIFYVFDGVQRKAKSAGTNFRRVAEKPGTFKITAVSDKASECKANTDITKIIHEMPSVKISKGKQLEVDIHEGGEAEILFEFWGTPPFEFTYTRSTNARKGQKSEVLETRHETSYEYSKTVQSSLEGTYEVVAIKDKFCSFSTQKETGAGQKYLTY